MTFYTACADDTTFSLKDLNSMKKVLEMLDLFLYLRLPPNLSERETAGIGSLKDTKVPHYGLRKFRCGLNSLDLTKESAKILGVHMTCNKKPQDDSDFCAEVKNTGNVIKLWFMRH